MERRSDEKSDPQYIDEFSETSAQMPRDKNMDLKPSETLPTPSIERTSDGNENAAEIDKSGVKGETDVPTSCSMQESPQKAKLEVEHNIGGSVEEPNKSENGSGERRECSKEEDSETEGHTTLCANVPQNSENQQKPKRQESQTAESLETENITKASVDPHQYSKARRDDQQQKRKRSTEEKVPLAEERIGSSSSHPQNSENQSKDLPLKRRQPSSEDLVECPGTIDPDPIPPQGQRMDREPEVANSPSHVPNIPSTNIGVAILVTVCFNLPFGVLAMYFSLMATKAYRDGHPKKGEKKARISVYISLFSIVLTVLIVMAIVLMKAMEGQSGRRRYATKTSVSL